MPPPDASGEWMCLPPCPYAPPACSGAQNTLDTYDPLFGSQTTLVWLRLLGAGAAGAIEMGSSITSAILKRYDPEAGPAQSRNFLSAFFPDGADFVPPPDALPESFAADVGRPIYNRHNPWRAALGTRWGHGLPNGQGSCPNPDRRSFFFWVLHPSPTC